MYHLAVALGMPEKGGDSKSETTKNTSSYSLKQLLLDQNLFDCEGVEYISAVLDNKNCPLEHLSLCSNGLQAAGLQILCKGMCPKGLLSLVVYVFCRSVLRSPS